jgi:hypothetical protein
MAYRTGIAQATLQENIPGTISSVVVVAKAHHTYTI